MPRRGPSEPARAGLNAGRATGPGPVGPVHSTELLGNAGIPPKCRREANGMPQRGPLRESGTDRAHLGARAISLAVIPGPEGQGNADPGMALEWNGLRRMEGNAGRASLAQTAARTFLGHGPTGGQPPPGPCSRE